jgi:ELWxxDGT repeat protein
MFTADSSVSGPLVRVGNYGYFSAGPAAGDYALYRTDLTPSGTVPVLGNFTTAPSSLVKLDNALFFLATDATHGLEIWRSDGTGAGTAPVTDFADPKAKIGPLTAGPGGQVFFSMQTTASGNELWRTDGTLAGTQLVKDIVPGTGSSTPKPIAVIGDRLLFTADDGVRAHLWSTDGTEANTVVIPVSPTGGESPVFSGGSLVTGDGRLFFAGLTSAGTELWTSDGTQAGTYLVKEIRPTSSSSFPTSLTEFNGKVYFEANDGTHGQELWVTDGTPDGTNLAVDLVPGPDGAGISGIVATGGRLYVAGADLYATDGTPAGTVDLATGLPSGQVGVAGLSVAGDQVFFVAAASPGAGQELWASAGTPATTRAVADVFPGPGNSAAVVIGALDSKVLFAASDVIHGTEPWVSDGTTANTRMLRDTAPATAPLQVHRTLAAGDVLYVMGQVGTSRTYVTLATDGTRSGTRLLTGGADDVYAVRGNGNRIFFGGYRGVWTSEGTPESTVRLTTDVVPDPYTTGSYHHVAFAGGNFYYLKRVNSGTSELWKSDGTPGGTSSILHLRGDISTGTIAYFQPVGERLFFYAYDQSNSGYEPWVSDGTPQGTMLLKDVNPGPDGSTINTTSAHLFEASAGGLVYFIADDGTVHNGLWVTDGRPGGTRFVRDLVPGTPAMNPTFTAWDVAGQTVFFTFFGSPSGGIGLWRSDGTAAGTSIVIDSGPSNWQDGVAVWNGGVFYAVPGPSSTLTRNTLYRYDIASGAVTAIRTFATKDRSPGLPIAMPDGVYFQAATSEAGMETWRTDGTTAGTSLVVDATPGTASSPVASPYDSAFKGAVWFPAASRLWVTPDIVPPAITAATFDPAAKPTVKLQFDQELDTPPTSDDFELVNRSTKAMILATALQVDYDSTTFQATLTFITESGQPLPDGDYRLIVRAGSLTDAAGNPLAADYSFDFFILSGDANHDRAVDFNDLVKLAQNYNTTGGKTYADGDFTGDGDVNFNDLVILAQHYNTALAPLDAAAMPDAPTSSFAADWAAATAVSPLDAVTSEKKKIRPKSIFSLTPVAKPMPAKPKPRKTHV